MPVDATDIEGLFVVRSPTHGDERGFFRETYLLSELTDALGRQPVMRQGNHSHSVSGVLRGFHAEPWDKLVYVVRGLAFAAIADIRPASSTFGEVRTFMLGEPPDGERIRLFVSEGLANSFLTLGDDPTDYLYDVGSEYLPGPHPAVAWDDPDLAVKWPIEAPLLSEKDHRNPTLRQLVGDHPRWH